MSEKRLIALTTKAKETGMLISPPHKNGFYLTGQHANENNPNGLTQEEIKNPDKIRPERFNEFGYVISVDTYMRITNNQKINPEGNASERAIWGLIQYQPHIAKSRSEVNPSKHDFYIDDPVQREDDKYKQYKKKKKATDLVDDAGLERQKTLLIYASSQQEGLVADPRNMSPSQIYNRAMEIAETSTDIVTKFFDNKDQDVQAEIAMLELVTYDIISKDSKGFWDGKNFLGENIKQVTDFLNDPIHAATRDRLFKGLSNKKNNSYTSSTKTSNERDYEAEEYLKSAKIAFAEGDIDKALSYIGNGQTIEMSKSLNKKFDEFHNKILNSTTKNAAATSEQKDVNLNEMSAEEIKSYFRKNKITGWKNNMNKDELIEVFTSNKVK